MNLTTVTLNDFDITYYPGITSQDVIPRLIEKLQTTFENLPKDSIQYKAIQTYIRLLYNYLTISNTFSKQTVQTLDFFNELSEHLSDYARKLYPEYDIYLKPKGRIKSPISANTKIKEKIYEYMQKKRDLDSLTIKDFIAFRFVVDVRDAFGNLIPESISVKICYELIGEALKFIDNYDFTTLLPITKFPEENNNVPNSIYRPLERPEFIEQNHWRIKDYMYMPKLESNYQSAHLQFTLSLPDLDESIFGELQFRTFLMNEHAERGPASHESYKAREKVTYLAIPQILMPIAPYSNKVDFISPDMAFEDFLGFSTSQINPQMSFKFFREFLEENNYSLPILPMKFKKDETGQIVLSDIFKETTMPIEVIGTDDIEKLQVLVGDIFEEVEKVKNIEHEK